MDAQDCYEHKFVLSNGDSSKIIFMMSLYGISVLSSAGLSPEWRTSTKENSILTTEHYAPRIEEKRKCDERNFCISVDFTRHHLRTHFGRPHRTPVALLIGLYEVFLSDFMTIGKVPEGVMTLRSAKDE